MKKIRKRKVHRGRRKQNRFVAWFQKLSIKKKIALIAGVCLLVLAAAVAIFVANKFSKLQTVKFKPEDLGINSEIDEMVGEGYTNFVLFAGDSRTGQLAEGVRSDGIIIASLNNETLEVKLVSVYRDTLLDLTDGNITKCNAAYSYGGPKQAISMLNKNLDLNIKQFVTVDFKAVSEVIDMLGGIEVEVSDAEVTATNRYIGETARVAGKSATYLKRSGLQTLNGVQATTYGRIRKGVGDDYARTERQRLIIQKTIEKALKSNLTTLNAIVDKVLPMVYTNLTEKDIISYATHLAKYKVGETKGFPFDKTSATLSGRGSCVIPVTLADNVKQLHEFLFEKTDYQVSSTVQSISNEIESIVGTRQPDPNQTYDPGPTTNTNVDDGKDDDKNNNDDKKDNKNNKHKHVWSSAWTGSDANHWHECEADGCTVTDNAKKKGYGAHSGGKATCISGAVCTICNMPYGNVDPNNHVEIGYKNRVEPTTEKEGYEGDKYCKGCGKELGKGKTLEKLPSDNTTTPGEGTGDDGSGNTPGGDDGNNSSSDE